MAKTLIADILKPDNWSEYALNPTAEQTAFLTSGILSNLTGLTLPIGGGTINMPFFNDLSGDLENLSDTAALTVGNISATKDVAVVLGRGRAFSVNDLAALLSGADPVRAIMEMIDRYEQRQLQKELIGLLDGAFSAASMAGNVLDISAGATEILRAINQGTFIDATQLLGDMKDGLTAIVMHSAVEAYLAKQQMIIYETTADKGNRIPTYMGKRVIVDDTLPVVTGTYTTYLFGEGAVGFEKDTIGANDLETDRDILAGDTVATFRRRFILHPRGIRWQGVAVSAFPSRAELAVGTNWIRAYENKQIRMVQFKHKIA